MDDKGFIKFIRESKEYEMLILRRPTAFVLLSLIVKRAKRTNDHPYPELEMGEALIGDYRIYGATERTYRTDKKYLEKFNFSTFKTTSKGTIAKLTNSSVFDINIEEERRTNRQTERHVSDDQATTNKNVKEEKNNSLKNKYNFPLVHKKRPVAPSEYADNIFTDNNWGKGPNQ
jgi:hypothetical protein